MSALKTASHAARKASHRPIASYESGPDARMKGDGIGTKVCKNKLNIAVICVADIRPLGINDDRDLRIFFYKIITGVF